jgi:hypothetical protein
MIAFGLFVLLAVGIIAGFTFVAGDDPAVVNLLGCDLETTERWQFATGALCALSAVAAIRLIVIGWRRVRRRQAELRVLRETVSQQTKPLSEPVNDPHPDHRSDKGPEGRPAKRSQGGRYSWDESDHFDSTPHD